MELFLWAHGFRRTIAEMLSDTLTMEAITDLGRVEDAQEIAVLVQERQERPESTGATSPEVPPA
jgi:hypothetical protein